MIWCSRCDRDLNPEAFCPSHRTPGAWCRSCRNEYQRQHGRTPCIDCGSRSVGQRCRSCRNTLVKSTPPQRKPQRKPNVGAKRISNDARYKALRVQVFAEETCCGFCGDVVDRSLPHTDKMSASIDHIVPVALGGAPFDRSNVRLAHRSCNSRAGNSAKAEAERERLALARAALWLGQRLAS